MTTWKPQFSINRVVHSLIPHRHRKLRMVAWVKVFVSYLVFIKDMLSQRWDETWLDAAITPQVAFIEQVLWIRFETGGEGISISEGFMLGPFIFTLQEDPELEFFMGDGTIEDTYVFNNRDAVEVDFVVEITNAFTNAASEIAALVHRYKLPGKSFILQLK